ncbi:ribosome-binding protein 1-like [Salmo trutta]|uniref:ribosome-binding protein 1-like n=1 Tax=Salmo trutta TaxID=8032 RepID=UPI00113050FC|nr:ribosome-binding protein 1-like [Salmo trutta]
MEVYDSQTLGFMVFGGFMAVSAIGIALVSTLSMKEMPYEEALAKHRRFSMKQKALENKSKGKKKEEWPNGNFPEPVAESASEPEPEPLASPELEPESVIAAPAPVMVACAARGRGGRCPLPEEEGGQGGTGACRSPGDHSQGSARHGRATC